MVKYEYLRNSLNSFRVYKLTEKFEDTMNWLKEREDSRQPCVKNVSDVKNLFCEIWFNFDEFSRNQLFRMMQWMKAACATYLSARQVN